MPPLVPVTRTLWGMEYSIHPVPSTHKHEVQAVFPGLDLSNVLIIPTCQPSDLDLVTTGPSIDLEKDRLLERFASFSEFVCNYLLRKGHWADYIDPCSGLPMLGKDTYNASIYSEVDGLATLLQYQTQNAGCCKIVLHPKWGSSVYPASLFTAAPLNMVQEAIARAEKELAESDSAA